MIDFSSRQNVYCVGIKGTGMAALAEFCRHAGAHVEGSDVAERFYTDDILESLDIPVHTPFNASNLPEKIDFLFYSAAYSPETNPELKEAASRGVKMYSYPQALGLISAGIPVAGIAGVHGKTTTTALAGTVAKETGFPAAALVGSAVSSFGNRSCMFAGDKALIAETCEYRRHFLNIHPRWIIVTSIEPDHLDYFSGYDDIYNAFMEYTLQLPEGGSLIYCADDAGATQLAGEVSTRRSDIRLISYGFTAKGEYRITDRVLKKERLVIRLQGIEQEIRLRIPGDHTARNAAGAAALMQTMADDLKISLDKSSLAESFESFRGSKRRSEVIGEAGGILFMDDYAHHPTAITTTLSGIRSFYPGRRIIVDFMSHTYSRTESLLQDFAAAFSDADMVILHRIYASAREKKGNITGETLYNETRKHHDTVIYIANPDDAHKQLVEVLKPGDLFITMGAGDNWHVAYKLYDLIRSEGE